MRVLYISCLSDKHGTAKKNYSQNKWTNRKKYF